MGILKQIKKLTNIATHSDSFILLNIYPMHFCLKWFGVIQLDIRQYSLNKYVYKLSYVGLALKYLSLIYIIIVCFLNLTRILDRHMSLIDNSTLFFIEACGLTCIVIFLTSMIITDSNNTRKIWDWFVKIDSSNLIETEKVNSNTFYLSVWLVCFFILNFCPIIFIYIKNDFEEGLSKAVVGSIYHLTCSKCLLLIYFTVNCIYALTCRFNVINKTVALYSRVIINRNSSKNLFDDQFVKLLKIHSDLCDLLEEFNEIYGFVRASSLLYICSECSISAFWLIMNIMGSQNKGSIMNIFMNVWWFIFNFVNMVLPYYVSEKCTRKVNIKLFRLHQSNIFEYFKL